MVVGEVTIRVKKAQNGWLFECEGVILVAPTKEALMAYIGRAVDNIQMIE